MGLSSALHGKKFEIADLLIKKGKFDSETEFEIGCLLGPIVLSFLKKRNMRSIIKKQIDRPIEEMDWSLLSTEDGI